MCLPAYAMHDMSSRCVWRYTTGCYTLTIEPKQFMMIAQVALCAAAAQFGFHRLVQSFLDPRMNMFWRPSSIMVRALNDSRMPCVDKCMF